MSIANEINRIKAAKESLKNAINAKGGNLNTELLDDYAAAVANLPTGGGSSADLSFVTAKAEDILTGKIGADVNGNPVHGTIPEMTVEVTEDKITVPVGYNKMQREFELNTGETVEIEYGYIDENGEFQPVDLSGETPVISGNPVAVDNAGFYDIPADEADYTTELDEPEPEPEPEPDRTNFLTLTASEPNSTVKLTLPNGNPETSGLMYRTDVNSNFVKYEKDQTITLSKAGDYVQFWNTKEELSNEKSYVKFVMTGSISASGNIQSMLNFSEEVKDYCYQGMFADCTSLTTAPELPATTLKMSCYKDMFADCTSLTTAPELPATTLDYTCYQGMFANCTSLTTAPELPATTLRNGCCQVMFRGCTSLTTAPELPATRLAESCYSYMFADCTSLTTAPELPATTLRMSCYQGMFANCTSLTTAPELPATTLDESCYKDMFRYCTSLTTAPELPATRLDERCYYGMFFGCSLLSIIKVAFKAWDEYDYATMLWLDLVPSTGTFYKPSALPEIYDEDHIPSGWTVVNID